MPSDTEQHDARHATRLETPVRTERVRRWRSCPPPVTLRNHRGTGPNDREIFYTAPEFECSASDGEVRGVTVP